MNFKMFIFSDPIVAYIKIVPNFLCANQDIRHSDSHLGIIEDGWKVEITQVVSRMLAK